MRESRGKVPNKERVEPKARSEAERILLLNQALRSVAEIVDAALRDDHRSEYFAKQVLEHLAQAKIEPGAERKAEPPRASAGPGEFRCNASGAGANVIVTPYASAEVS